MVCILQRTSTYRKTANGYHIPYTCHPPVQVPIGSTIHLIGEINGFPAKTYAVYAPIPGDENSEQMLKDLRASFDVLPIEEYKQAGKASQILNWDKNSRYCPCVVCLPCRFQP